MLRPPDAGCVPRGPREQPHHPQLLPFLLLAVAVAVAGPLAAQSAHTELDVAYVAGGGTSQSLDLYLPQTKHYPTMIFFHGGSLLGGDKRDEPTDSICRNFVAKGIGCVSANYRIFPSVRWPVPANDAAAAVAWIARHIGERGGDSTRLFLVGHSSGCMLVSLLATDPRYLAGQHMTPAALRGVVAMGCLLDAAFDTAGMAPSRVKNFFATNGYLKCFGSIDTLIDAAPMTHLSRNLPPMLITIADSEQVAPPILAQAKPFVARAVALGVPQPPVIRVLPNRRHMTALNLMASSADPTLALLVEFILTGKLPKATEGTT